MSPLPSAFASAASYWIPRHLSLSAWLQHAPFASWIIEATRPRLVAELGSHTGFSFFAFAEATRRLGIDTRLVAVDSWEGDDHAGHYGDEVYQSVRAIVESDYAERAELRRGYFSEVRPSFADGSIDLLHIDGRHGYEDVKEDFETYLPALSDRAVVLFHDCYEFREGFGVHRFWDEIAPTAPSFRFLHGHGLGVLVVGEEAPDTVRAFVEYASENEDEVRDFYAERGQEVEQSYVNTVLAAAAGERQERIDVLEAAVRERDARIVGLTQELRQVLDSTSWKVTAPLRAVRRR